MGDRNVEIVKEIFTAWTSRDPLRGREHLAPDCTVEMTGFPLADLQGTRQGYSGVQEFVAGWMAAFGSLDFEPEEFIDEGHHVIVPARMLGTGRQSGVGASGFGVVVYSFEGDKVKRIHAFRSLEDARASIAP
jgi:ketosteroid isomerase-like protein